MANKWCPPACVITYQLFASRHINRCLRAFPAEYGRHITSSPFPYGFVGFLRAPRAMRGDVNEVMVEQRVVCGRRLGRKYIQRGASNSPVIYGRK